VNYDRDAMGLTASQAEVATELVAVKLQKLKGSPRFVFIGGGTVPLHLTELRSPDELRPTKDIDVVIAVATYADYNEISGQLRKLGFKDDMQLPIRWHLDDLIVDVLPTADIGHGLGNRWFHLVMEHAVKRKVASGTTVELATPPVLLATKLEAFNDRGAKDVLASHDLEDIMTLLDGRPEIVDETLKMPNELRKYLAEQAARLLALPDIGYALQGNLEMTSEDEGRAAAVTARLNRLAEMK
jgi:predicted nucleotidyltransferase